MNTAILGISSVIYSSWEYDWKPSLEENRGKIADFFGETHFEVKVKSPNPSQRNIAVLSIADFMHLHGYQKIG